jgi:tetratricopeptide (TPR) repeat protein
VSGPEPRVKSAPGGFGGRTLLAAALAFAGAALLLYAPALPAPFFSDDVLYLEHDPAFVLPARSTLRRVLLEPWFANWSPLHRALLWAEWRAFGASPLPYRVLNVGLHAGAALALATAARRGGLSRGAALAAGALLLVHPAAVEAVAWISQSKTLLCVGLSLAALERWLAHLAVPARRRLAAALALGSAALLAKPAALPLPAILLGAAACAGADLRRAARALAPLAAVAAVVLVRNLLAQARGGGVAEWFGGSPLATAAILPWLAWRYVRLAFAPTGLVHGVHPAPVAAPADPALWGPLLGLAAAAAIALALCRLLPRTTGEEDRPAPSCAFGPLWFAAMLAPVLQLVPMQTVYADRYLYAALPGALWLVAQLGDDAARAGGPRARRALAAAAVLLAVAFAAGTSARARVWADPEALYREATVAFPLGVQGWTGLGATLHERGDLDGADAAYRRALALRPRDAQVRYLLARARLARGERARALYDLEAALRIGSGHYDRAWMTRAAQQLRRRGVTPLADPPTDAPAEEAPP